MLAGAVATATYRCWCPTCSAVTRCRNTSLGLGRPRTRVVLVTQCGKSVLQAVPNHHAYLQTGVMFHLTCMLQTVRDALFDGCGFVPDIPSLQALVESAWAKGWDTCGLVPYHIDARPTTAGCAACMQI